MPGAGRGSIGNLHTYLNITSIQWLRFLWRQSQKISDEKAILVAKDVAKKVKDELDYPGQIKVTVIREMRAIEYAR